jgi:hypothetical protein
MLAAKTNAKLVARTDIGGCSPPQALLTPLRGRG